MFITVLAGIMHWVASGTTVMRWEGASNGCPAVRHQPVSCNVGASRPSRSNHRRILSPEKIGMNKRLAITVINNWITVAMETHTKYGP